MGHFQCLTIFSGQSLNENLLQLSFQWNYLKRRHNSETAWFSDWACLLLWLVSATASLRTQTYFRLSLVSAENNFCEPEPGNDFRDVGILSQSQSSSSCLRTTARGICCEEHSSFILSWNLIGQGETKVVTSQKSFLTQNSQQTWTSKFS